MDAVTTVPAPRNEPVLDTPPCSGHGQPTHHDTKEAARCAAEAAPAWRDLSFDDRAAVSLRAADLRQRRPTEDAR